MKTVSKDIFNGSVYITFIAFLMRSFAFILCDKDSGFTDVYILVGWMDISTFYNVKQSQRYCRKICSIINKI